MTRPRSIREREGHGARSGVEGVPAKCGGADEPWIYCSSAASRWCPPGRTPIVQQYLSFTMMTCPSDRKREKASMRTHLGLLN